jgi:hypothetical protein
VYLLRVHQPAHPSRHRSGGVLFGLYLLGAGSPAPIVPTAPTLRLATAASYVHLRSFPTKTALTTVLTERVQA